MTAQEFLPHVGPILTASVALLVTLGGAIKWVHGTHSRELRQIRKQLEVHRRREIGLIHRYLRSRTELSTLQFIVTLLTEEVKRLDHNSPALARVGELLRRVTPIDENDESIESLLAKLDQETGVE